MKVIDLLNKLYNMEEVPKRIKIGCSYLTLNKNKDNYIYDNKDEYYGNELIHWYDLDTKVEIIEDKKEEVEMIYRDNDINYLKGIIKEVREYIEIQQKIFKDYDIAMENQLKNVLEILDKEKDNE